MSVRPSSPDKADRAEPRAPLRHSTPARRPSQIFRKVASEPSRSEFRDLAMIACFLMAISLPLVGLLLSLDSGFVLEENQDAFVSSRVGAEPKRAGRIPGQVRSVFQ